jgi:malate dehydrogenase (oxaloacetate-decarboxylating)(NADP+)
VYVEKIFFMKLARVFNLRIRLNINKTTLRERERMEKGNTAKRQDSPEQKQKKDKERADALAYHKNPNGAGKFEIRPTKPMNNAQDLSLAYSPGVAQPCLEIKADKSTVYDYTIKGNCVAVISNGTAVLGLGNIGALAAKPVMEGKAVLFKKFAGLDSVDICIDTQDPYQFINCVKYLAPSFGGINLEDIKAPECFFIEKTLKSMMNIPVFHDDQHGTAVICLAALMNACEIVGKKI